MSNAYPDLPALAFQRTSVAMTDVIATLNAFTAPLEVRRAGYVMFRTESANGSKGINNNYIGAQADSGAWPDTFTSLFAGTVTIRENGTNRLRIFLAFKNLDGNIAFLADRVLKRGLYIGGKTHVVLDMPVKTEQDLAIAYHREWVTGSATSLPSADEAMSFLSMYRQASHLIV